MPNGVSMNADTASQLDVQQLYTFRDVFRLGGYAAAAAQSNLSVPTIWQHIQGLEKLYKVRLFEKVGRRVQPTDAAHQLFAAVDEILAGLESTFDLAQSDLDSPHALILMAGNRMMMEDLAAPLAEFQKKFPNRLMIRHGNNKRAEEALLANEADIALSLEPGLEQQSSQIHYEPAYFVDFLAVSPPRHPFARLKNLTLRQIVKHPLIVTAPGTHGRDALEQSLYRDRLSANIVVETDNSGFTIACVQAGMGVGILAGRPDGQFCRKLTTHSLRKPLGQRQIVFMWRKGRRLSEPALGVIDEIRHYHAGDN